MKNLCYNYICASMNGEGRHAQEVMKSLGIKYTHSTPQSIGDQYWFWNCENLPKDLPVYIDSLKADPIDSIGYGLSEEEAKEIISLSKKQ